MAFPKTMAEVLPYLEAIVGEIQGLSDQCNALRSERDALFSQLGDLQRALLSQRQATDEAMRRAEEARRELAVERAAFREACDDLLEEFGRDCSVEELMERRRKPPPCCGGGHG